MTDLDLLAVQVRAARRSLDQQAGRALQVAADGKAAEEETARLSALADRCAKVAALLSRVGEEEQERARAMFESLATRALRVIFDDSLSFRLVPGESGGQVTLEPVLRSSYDGEDLDTAVIDARGYGMAAVVGFVLRLVMVKLTPRLRDILLLDESFRFVSEGYVDRLGEFLREVTTRLGIQIVMITHDRAFSQYADARVRLALGPGGVTQVFEGEAE